MFLSSRLLRLFFFYKSGMDGTETLFTPERLVNICELERTELTFSAGLHVSGPW